MRGKIPFTKENMYQIIFNPTAGKKNTDKDLQTVCDLMKNRNLAFQVHRTATVRDSERIARRLTRAGENDLVVLGGDGTLHEVLNGIDDPTRCKIGLIPIGTGNDFATKLGIPLDVTAATNLILDGQAKPVDYLEVGNRRCMNVAGFGMDVDVLERCHKGKMKGKPKYLMSLMQSIFAFKGCALTVESEGKRWDCNALVAVACNGSQFGGGIRICPAAEVDDHKISVVTVDCFGGVFKLIKAFVVLLKGNILTYPATKYFLCERVKFTPKKPCTVQLDGELYTDLDMDVKIKSGLRMYF